MGHHTTKNYAKYNCKTAWSCSLRKIFNDKIRYAIIQWDSLRNSRRKAPTILSSCHFSSQLHSLTTANRCTVKWFVEIKLPPITTEHTAIIPVVNYISFLYSNLHSAFFDKCAPQKRTRVNFSSPCPVARTRIPSSKCCLHPIILLSEYFHDYTFPFRSQIPFSLSSSCESKLMAKFIARMKKKETYFANNPMWHPFAY